MPSFSYHPTKKCSRFSVHVNSKDSIKSMIESQYEIPLKRLIRAYFSDEFKVEFFFEWLRRVARDELVDKAILINDCSFSHAFTKELVRLLSEAIPQCEFVYLIRERHELQPLNEKQETISLELLDILIHEEISTFKHKPDVESNCIIAIPYSSYLRRELNPSSTFVVLNVASQFSNIIHEIEFMKVFKDLNKQHQLSKELEEEFKH